MKKSPVAGVLKEARIDALKKVVLPDLKGFVLKKDLKRGKIIVKNKPRYEIQSFDYADPKGRSCYSIYDNKEGWHVFPMGVEWIETAKKKPSERIKRICKALNLLDRVEQLEEGIVRRYKRHCCTSIRCENYLREAIQNTLKAMKK